MPSSAASQPVFMDAYTAANTVQAASMARSTGTPSLAPLPLAFFSAISRLRRSISSLT
jgi:hypothetical protein